MLTISTDWVGRAQCRGMDFDAVTERVCDGCPVTTECGATYNVAAQELRGLDPRGYVVKELGGVWGGRRQAGKVTRRRDDDTCHQCGSFGWVEGYGMCKKCYKVWDRAYKNPDRTLCRICSKTKTNVVDGWCRRCHAMKEGWV